MRNIDPARCRSEVRSKVSIVCQNEMGETRRATPMVKQRTGILLAVVVLCGTVAGCVSDMTEATADHSGNGQLRYYGGPKYPMWPSQ